MPSFYAPHLTRDMKIFTIGGEEFHHIINVFRKKENEQITLTNGRGQAFEAVIEHIGKRDLTLKTLSSITREKSEPRIAVGFSLLRNKHDHMIVEKLTELGVSEFHPLVSERSVRSAGDNTVDKFIKTAIAAMKQCDNLYLPEVHPVKGLKETLQYLQDNGYMVYAALERGVKKLISDNRKEPYPDKIALIFGPEGGFSDQELNLFAEMEIEGFTIGNHILRAETAAIAGVSQLLLKILQYRPDYY